ncbi:helix-turn-helix domain-containing protein [Zhihengliuella flava]|uniref:Excisionase family DNA binding protein n=1 Tax=Zhihengliuella flava TaxID=1285193 RepID=A0A931DC37_9MICC|nr:helix-turn-helix domain-containing protein [Zhihengliuella flava]MBG6085858.1 excisionase family DNA binding protein [Zhihengliuella flava]
MNRLLNVKQAAELMGMHPDTVREMLRRGDLAGIKNPGLRGSWRIEESAIERWKRRNTYYANAS